ncbi:MAG: putative metal-binding motif-containing protein [Chloroflexi bacterium]|nr:putative metal-binding motif-containing protein [Chloroflexota bacterium]
MPKLILLITLLGVFGLVGCEQVAQVAAVLTPAPTYTPYPTYTLYPTYTPYPPPAEVSATTPVPVNPAPTPIPPTATPVPVQLTTYYWDQDGDGFGDPQTPLQASSQPAGYVTDNSDCDDTDVSVNPASLEVPDNIDNNCNGQIDEGTPSATYYLDRDGDGFGDPQSPFQANSQPPGYVTDNTDCDDTDVTVNPASLEVPDDIDNNCDGEIDEGTPSGTYYLDQDGDGFGSPDDSIEAISQPAGYVENNTDCDDSDPEVNPPAAEIADNKDNNCDGRVDEGVT